MLTVAAYLRDSGGEDQDLSLSQQETELRAYCAAHDLQLIAIYKDEARPGSSVVGRTAFQDMIHTARSGAPWQAVLIWKYSRFSRQMDDAQFYRADLRRHNIDIISIHDQIPPGNTGRFFEAALDWMNAQFLADLSTDVRRGLRDLVRTYGCVPGTPPRGFKREPLEIGRRRDGSPHIAHRWVPDPDLAPTILQAFTLRATGATLRQIHKETALFKTLNSYTTFFSNRLYIGILKFGDMEIEAYCPPLIPIETWNAVQARAVPLTDRSTRRLHPRQQASSFLLTGIAYCAQCGSPLYGHSISTKHDHAYRCTLNKRGGKCTARRIPRRLLEETVVLNLRDFVFTPQTLTALDLLFVAEEQKRAETLSAARASLTKRIGQMTVKINRLTSAVAEAGHSAALLARLAELERQQTDLQLELVHLQKPPPPLRRFTLKELEHLCQNLHRLLDALPPEDLRRILHTLIQRITVERDGKQVRGIIDFYYPPPFDFALTDNGISMHVAPVGAQFHRYTFQHQIKSP
jgi:DNA invertase Pin-like site-specific DNA recombinase